MGGQKGQILQPLGVNGAAVVCRIGQQGRGNRILRDGNVLHEALARSGLQRVQTAVEIAQRIGDGQGMDGHRSGVADFIDDGDASAVGCAGMGNLAQEFHRGLRGVLPDDRFHGIAEMAGAGDAGDDIADDARLELRRRDRVGADIGLGFAGGDIADGLHQQAVLRSQAKALQQRVGLVGQLKGQCDFLRLSELLRRSRQGNRQRGRSFLRCGRQTEQRRADCAAEKTQKN